MPLLLRAGAYFVQDIPSRCTCRVPAFQAAIIADIPVGFPFVAGAVEPVNIGVFHRVPAYFHSIPGYRRPEALRRAQLRPGIAGNRSQRYQHGQSGRQQLFYHGTTPFSFRCACASRRAGSRMSICSILLAAARFVKHRGKAAGRHLPAAQLVKDVR